MMNIIGIYLSVPLLIVVAFLRFYLSSGTWCKIKTRLEGKIIIITGGYTGIGRALALDVARRGAKVIIACRNKTKAEAAVTQLRQKSGSDDVHFLHLDLASVKSVRDFANLFSQRYGGAYALVNNAAYMGPKAKSEDGLDLCFQVNYLGHFLLTHLIISASKPEKSNPLRVINLTSDSYKNNMVDFNDLLLEKTKYDMYQAYGRTKLAMIWFTNELNFRHAGTGVISVAVHPGPVKTSLLRNWPGLKGSILRFAANLLFRSPEIGAQSIVQCLVVDYLEDYIGKMIYDCKAMDVDSVGREYKHAERLWSVSSSLCNIDEVAVQKGENGVKD